MSIQTITPHELDRLHQEGKPVELIDVRTPVEFRELHAAYARNVPLDELSPDAAVPAPTSIREEPVYLICRSGSRGRLACEKFVAAGYANVVNVEGGTLAWAERGLPVVRGKKAVSLERQVRIAAGLLVLLSVTLCSLVHPAFVILAAVVGTGLVYAGISDTCGMALLLARMPWNRIHKPGPTCHAR